MVTVVAHQNLFKRTKRNWNDLGTWEVKRKRLQELVQSVPSETLLWSVRRFDISQILSQHFVQIANLSQNLDLSIWGNSDPEEFPQFAAIRLFACGYDAFLNTQFMASQNEFGLEVSKVVESKFRLKPDS